MAVPLFLGPPVALTTNSPFTFDYGSVAGLSGGNLAVVAMHESMRADSTEMTVQVFSGESLRSIRSLVLDAGANGISGTPWISALSSGGFTVFWESVPTFDVDSSIWAQSFDASGIRIGGKVRINEAGASTGSWADTAQLLGGQNFVAFDQYSPGPGGTPGSWDVFARLFGGDGSAGNALRLNANTGFNEGAVQIIGTPDGGFMAIWLRKYVSTADGPRDQLVSRTFDSSGMPTGIEIVRMTASAGQAILDIDLALLSGRQVAVTWRLAEQMSGQVLSQMALLTEAGYVLIPGYVAPAGANSASPRVLPLNDGRLIFAWNEIDTSNRTGSIRAVMVSPSGSVSEPFTLLANSDIHSPDFELTELADGRVILVYNSPDGAGDVDRMRQVIDPREARIVLTGSDANDAWLGTRFDDVLTGNGGNDRINGGSGNDRMHGGLGDDSLIGGFGNDRMIGWAGNDTVRGGAGNDLITGETGNDSLFGDAGNDTLNGSAGLDTMTGGLGADTFVLTASRGRDVVTDYQLGTDDIDLRAFAFASLDAAKAAFTQVSGGALLKVGTVEVLFTGLDASLLQSTDVLL